MRAFIANQTPHGQHDGLVMQEALHQPGAPAGGGCVCVRGGRGWAGGGASCDGEGGGGGVKGGGGVVQFRYAKTEGGDGEAERQ
jgi:hypothetical protein